MKCSGKRLVKYLKILNRNSRGEVSLQRFFKAEHHEAVASGYIQQVVQYADPNNDQRYKIYNKVWALTDDGDAFLRQLRGDFSPPPPKVGEMIDFFKSYMLDASIISSDMVVGGTTTGRWYSGDGNRRGPSILTPKVLNDAIQDTKYKLPLRK